jgi:hypothetical protein
MNETITDEGPRPMPGPGWKRVETDWDGEPVVIDYRVPLGSERDFDNPLLREVFDLPEPDVSTAWGRICAHLRATAKLPPQGGAE